MALAVDKETAKKEVMEWMEFMEANSDPQGAVGKMFIENLIDSVSKGHLVINEDRTITHKLKFPLGEGNTKEFKYDFRFTVGDYEEVMKGVNENEEIAYCLAKLRLISKQAPAVLRKMDRRDYAVARTVVVFF